METKFEYQVSPELAEKIALEQFDVLLRVRALKLKYLPITIGFLLALLLFCTSSFVTYFIIAPRYYSTWRLGGTSYSFTDSFLWVPIGFVLGFLAGSLIRGFIRWKIITTAQSLYQKTGPTRAVSWNSESITVQSTFYEIKIHWEMIDKIEIAPLAVYGLSGRRALFVIPGEAFPSNVTPQALMKARQSGKWQYPTTA